MTRSVGLALAGALLATLGLPVPGAPTGAAAVPARDAWNGTHAEVFLTDISEPTLTAGGPAESVIALLVNRGPSEATNVRFTYTVPAGLTYGDAKVGNTPCPSAAPTVVCSYARLIDGERQPVSVTLSAPAGTTPGAL